MTFLAELNLTYTVTGEHCGHKQCLLREHGTLAGDVWQ